MPFVEALGGSQPNVIRRNIVKSPIMFNVAKNGLNEGCVFETNFGGYMAFSILSYILSTAQIYKLSTTFVGLIFRSFKGDKKHVTSSFLSKQIALLKENRD